jgi:dihydroflavonol-4-reductase
MNVLLTGASGNLGYATVRELEKAGHTVVALVRPSSNVAGLQGTGATLAYGDVLDKAAVLSAARGCDAIIHQAAVFSTGTDHPDAIIRPAVEGARNVLEAAKACGIQRVVYTSSIIAIGMSTDPEVRLDGSTWNTATALPYAEAKTRSEQIAHDIARELGIELMVFCPGGIMGPGDYRVTPTHGLVLALLTGTMPLRHGGLNPVSVFDVANLHVQALTRGVPFKRYVAASHDNITYAQMFDLLQTLVGKPLPTPPAGEAGPALYSYYDITETCKDFDYSPKSASDVLQSTVAWFTATGMYPG